MNQIPPRLLDGEAFAKFDLHNLDKAATKALIRRLIVHCNHFRDPDNRRAASETLATIVPFLTIGAVLIWLAGYSAPLIGHWRWLAIAALWPLGAMFVVRLFMVQHDCGHGSFTSSRKANALIGRAFSVFTFTPYTLWQKSHALHHSSSGNLDKRGIGDIDTRTVAEYRAMTPGQQLAYRIYRNPFVLIILGMPLYFLIVHRFPYNDSISRTEATKSAVGLNIALVLFYGALAIIFGVTTVAVAILPMIVIGAWVGGWLFYVQHQFEETHWEGREEWDLHIAAFAGSSWYVMPPILQWFTGSIGLHHIHHLCSRIPSYRLQDCMDSSPELQAASERVKLTIPESFSCIRLALWDEDRRQLVSFAEVPA